MTKKKKNKIVNNRQHIELELKKKKKALFSLCHLKNNNISCLKILLVLKMSNFKSNKNKKNGALLTPNLTISVISHKKQPIYSRKVHKWMSWMYKFSNLR